MVFTLEIFDFLLSEARGSWLLEALRLVQAEFFVISTSSSGAAWLYSTFFVDIVSMALLYSAKALALVVLDMFP